MTVIVASAAAALIVALLFVMARTVTRWMSRTIDRSSQLGTVSRQWLAVHRAEDK